MKVALVWPICWTLYGIGHVASVLAHWLDRDDVEQDSEPGWPFRAAYRTYQSTMAWSFDLQLWAEFGNGYSNRLPWGPPWR